MPTNNLYLTSEQLAKAIGTMPETEPGMRRQDFRRLLQDTETVLVYSSSIDALETASRLASQTWPGDAQMQLEEIASADARRNRAHNNAILACVDINSLCDAYGVEPLVEYSEGFDRHVITSIATAFSGQVRSDEMSNTRRVARIAASASLDADAKRLEELCDAYRQSWEDDIATWPKQEVEAANSKDPNWLEKKVEAYRARRANELDEKRMIDITEPLTNQERDEFSLK